MPLVNIRIARDGASTEQKKQLIDAVTQAVSQTLGKSPKSTWVVIDEVEPENWGVGGETIAEMRAKQG
ncbi:MAG: tautomerase family protein [Gammaproteobacteria bacterium]